MTPGDGDLALGLDWLQAEATRTGAPFVTSNLRCGGQTPFPPLRRIDKDGVSVAILGILGEGETLPAGCEATAPAVALTAALAGLDPVDLVVLLSHQDPSLDEALAAAVPALDLVVNAGIGATTHPPRALPEAALQLAAGTRGKLLGLARIQLQPGGQGFASGGDLEDLERQLARARGRREKAVEDAATAEGATAQARARQRVGFYDGDIGRLESLIAAARTPRAAPSHLIENELLGLDVDVLDHAATAALLAAAKAEIEAAAAPVAVGPAAALEGPFVGSQVCSGCHVGPASQWATTAHARAWASLVGQARTQDQDCAGCHVTGAFHPEGPQAGQVVHEALRSVGCESCHGPGRAHVSDPAGSRLLVTPPATVCIQCHDGVRDEGRFQLDAYMDKVRHHPSGPAPTDPAL